MLTIQREKFPLGKNAFQVASLPGVWHWVEPLDEWSLWQLLEMTDSRESWLPAVKVSIFKAHQFQWECSTGPICYFWQRGKFLTWIWDSYWRSSLAANKMNFNMLPMNKRCVPNCWWNLTPSFINGNFALISFFSLLSFSSMSCSW